MQSLLSLNIQRFQISQMCLLCNMLFFQRNTFVCTFFRYFEKYREYSSKKSPTNVKICYNTQNTNNSKTTRTGIHKFYTVLKKTVMYYISEISVFKRSTKSFT